MKATTILKTLLILCIGFTFSCSNDDEAGTSEAEFTSIPEGTMSMEFNGGTWASDQISGFSSFSVATITVTGGIDLLFLVVENTVVGEYPITADSQTSITYRTLTGLEDFSTDARAGASGILNILEKDEVNNTISGTFSGTLMDEDGESRSITNGLFNKIPLD